MTRTLVLTTLWFFAGWVIGAMTAFVLGLPEVMAPVTATTAAVIAYRPAWLVAAWRPSRVTATTQSR